MRILRAVIALAGLAGAGAACSAILGVDADPAAAVDRMCKCSQLGFLGLPEACQATLRARLDGAQDSTRAAWLAAYVNQCTTCDHVLDCYYLAPTCASLACQVDEDCCGKNPGEKGTCEHDAGLCSP